MKKKKFKEKFSEFRNTEKSAYKTYKIPIKSILLNRDNVQPVLNDLVFEINDLVIHTYQFIRLYVLYKYNKHLALPVINETFILYCIKTLGTRDNRGKRSTDTILLDTLEMFYNTEYQPLLNHQKTNLKNTTFLLPYLASLFRKKLQQKRFAIVLKVAQLSRSVFAGAFL